MTLKACEFSIKFEQLKGLNPPPPPIINFYQFEIFAIKAAEKNKENNKKICLLCNE